MSRTVLVADDSPIIQKVIRLALKDENVEVIAMTNGTDAIEYIKQAPPAMVLADTRMPGHDGYEVGEFVKTTLDGRRIPVVLMIGAFESVDDTRVATVSDAILVKPFEPDQLVTTVRELLRSRPSVGEITVPSLDDRPPSETSVTTVMPPDSQSTVLPTSSPEAPSASSAASPVLRSSDLPSGIPPGFTEDLVERLVPHVIARLSDRVVRETTTEIVSKIAERVVREELERLKEKLR